MLTEEEKRTLLFLAEDYINTNINKYTNLNTNNIEEFTENCWLFEDGDDAIQ